MLLDKGLLALGSGDGYELDRFGRRAGRARSSLQGLIAARLDGLPARGTDAAAGRRGPGQDVPAPGDGGVERPRPTTGSMSCSPPWSARSSSSIQSSTRGRPTTASTGSSNRSCRRLRTTRSRRRTGGPGTSPSPSNLERTWTGDEDEIVEVIAAHLRGGVSARRPMSRSAEPRSAREGARRTHPSRPACAAARRAARRARRTSCGAAELADTRRRACRPPGAGRHHGERQRDRSMRRCATSRRRRRCSASRGRTRTTPLASRPASAM